MKEQHRLDSSTLDWEASQGHQDMQIRDSKAGATFTTRDAGAALLPQQSINMRSAADLIVGQNKVPRQEHFAQMPTLGQYAGAAVTSSQLPVAQRYDFSTTPRPTSSAVDRCIAAHPARCVILVLS